MFDDLRGVRARRALPLLFTIYCILTTVYFEKPARRAGAFALKELIYVSHA